MYEEIASVSMTTSDISLYSMRSNGLKSSGILVRHKSWVEAKKVPFAGQNGKTLRSEKVIETYFVSLHSDACLYVKLVGWKWASLAKTWRG